MTSKLVVNTIEADTGISSVSFASSISMSSTSKFHFGAAGIDIGADTNINRPASGVLGFNINSAEKFRIDSSGHIKAVGVCTATHFYGDGSNLTGITGTTINSNADNRIITGSGTANTLNGEANLTFDGNNINQTIDNSGEGIRITAPNNHYSVLRFDSNVSSANGSICNIQGHWNGNEVANIIFAAGSDTTNKDDGYIRIYTRESGQSNTERLRITSGGDLTFLNSSTAATADLSSIIFSNNSGEISRIRGQSRNGNTNGMITFHTDISGSSSEKMRINHDGGFCFGTDLSRTAEFSQPDGFSIRFDDKGQFQNSVTNTTGGYMNRKGSDGGILSFARQGTYVGEIGVNASSIYLNFGGTNATAHQLDDYEEGTFTPTYGNTGGVTPNYNYQEGFYTKIGNLVTCAGIIGCTNANSFGSGKIIKINLPFTCANNSYGLAGGGLADGSGFQNVFSGNTGVGVLIGGNTNEGRLLTLASSPSNVYYTGTPGLQNTHYFRFRYIYHV